MDQKRKFEGGGGGGGGWRGGGGRGRGGFRGRGGRGRGGGRGFKFWGKKGDRGHKRQKTEGQGSWEGQRREYSERHSGSYSTLDENVVGGEQQHGTLGGKKKVALVVGYCGSDFQGMQMNPGASSIEAELEKALYEAGCIKGANFGNLQKIAWSRAGRTDKGVHAASQIVGCKLHIKVGNDEEAGEGSAEAEAEAGGGGGGGAAAAAAAEAAAVEAEAEGVEVEAVADVGAPDVAEVEEPKQDLQQEAEAGAEAAADATAEEPSQQAPLRGGWDSEPKPSPEEMAAAFERAREAINARLPPSIRIHAVIRATRGFNAKNDCTKRRYCYMLPTFLLDDPERVAPLLDACAQVRKRRPKPEGEEQEAAADGAEGGGLDVVDERQEQEQEEAEEEGARGYGDDDDDEEGVAVAGDGGAKEGAAAAEGAEEEGGPAARTDLKPERQIGYDPGYPQPELSKLSEAFEADLRHYRITPERMERLRSTLHRYLGTHKFHNFSIRMSFKSGQANRFIISVTASDPFVRDGIEWTCITIIGQAFLLHQIRKMVGVAVITARGSAPEDLIDTAYGDAMITLPMAPSDGLFLDKPSFEKYNERATLAGMGGSLDWEADPEQSRVPPPPACVRERILAFKDEHIVGHITREEPRTLAFSKWLYHVRQRFEMRPRPFQPRELTVAELRSEVPKKHRPK